MYVVLQGADKGLDALVRNFIAARYETASLGTLDDVQLAEVADLCKGMAQHSGEAEAETQNVLSFKDYKRT